MTKILALVLLLGVFEAQGGPPQEPAGDRQAIVAAAQALLNKFWPNLERDRSSYGLSPADSLGTLSFGEPVELKGVRDESVRGYLPGQPVAKLAESTGHWFVPLVSRGSYVAMVEVLGRGQGQWQGSGIGWAPLARKWQAVSRRWPAGEQGGALLMIFYSQPGYYFSVPSVVPANLTPLASLSLGADGSLPGDFKPEEVGGVIDRLKTAIEAQPRD